jgi:aryl-alcohol dehydrogenase-like predicted oxidoreductase
MKKRRLGKSQLEIAPLALGGNVFGWTIDEAGSFQILDAFVSSGFNFVDTADAALELDRKSIELLDRASAAD